MSSRGRPWAREHERKQVGPPDRDVDDLRGMAGLWGGMGGLRWGQTSGKRVASTRYVIVCFMH